jgi:hypothetical protein
MELNYTTRDYDAYIEALKTKATELFPDWKTFNESNVGYIILELIAMMGDQNSWYLNRNSNQMFLPTVTTRRNLIKILKKMNYTLGGRVAASVDIDFIFENSGTHSQNVSIPKDTVITTEDGTYHFETTEELIITAGSVYGTVTAKNWTSQSEDLEFDGEANQEIYLQHENFIEDWDETVLIIESQTWTRQIDLLSSGPTDKHYRVEYDDELRAILIFGDGVTGAKPDGQGSIDYKTGGGEEANDIEIGAINTIVDTLTDAIGAAVVMYCENDASPSGGENEETITEAVKQAPKESKESDVTVSRPQYETNSQAVSGVARALALGRNEDGLISYNTVYVYIVPVGGGAPSIALKTAVETYLTVTNPVVMTSNVSILDGIYHNITVAGTITRNNSFTAEAVKTAVDAALEAYFDYENIDDQNDYTVDFGINKDTVYVSEIIAVILNTTINGIKCIENVTLASPSSNVNISQKEIPALQSLAGLTVS